MDSINFRIKLIREHFCDGSNKEFAKIMGRKENVVNNWVREGYSVGRGIANEIANKFGVDVEWIMIGLGEMLKSAAQTAPSTATDTITMPREAWEVIRDQAASLKAKDVSLERKDKQIDEMLAMLRQKIEKGEDAGYHSHAATRAAAE